MYYLWQLDFYSNQLRSQRLPGVYVLPAAKSPLSEYYVFKKLCWKFKVKVAKISKVWNDSHRVVKSSWLDKFASLRQVNSPYSWSKVQICCTDMYLIGFLPNFTLFFVFLWISWDFADLPEFRSSMTVQNIRSPAECSFGTEPSTIGWGATRDTWGWETGTKM